MAYCESNPKFSVRNSLPVSTLSHVNPLDNYYFCINIFLKKFLLLIRSRVCVAQFLMMLRQGWTLTIQAWSLSLDIKLVVEFGRRSKQPKPEGYHSSRPRRYAATPLCSIKQKEEMTFVLRLDFQSHFNFFLYALPSKILYEFMFYPNSHTAQTCLYLIM
jgi:hypothetical protein